jgi:hypothetical protein
MDVAVAVVVLALPIVVRAVGVILHRGGPVTVPIVALVLALPMVVVAIGVVLIRRSGPMAVPVLTLLLRHGLQTQLRVHVVHHLLQIETSNAHHIGNFHILRPVERS